jgi:hypothetical protein
LVNIFSNFIYLTTFWTIDEIIPISDTCIKASNVANYSFVLHTYFIMFCIENHHSHATVLAIIVSIYFQNFYMFGNFVCNLVRQKKLQAYFMDDPSQITLIVSKNAYNSFKQASKLNNVLFSSLSHIVCKRCWKRFSSQFFEFSYFS